MTEHRDQARAHFRAMFGDQAGWLELSAIEGDPDDRQHCRFHMGWFDYAPERIDTLIERIADLVHRYGNVYTSITLYSEPLRNKEKALPGRVVFVDDAQPGSYTYTTQTSRDREQAFVILDQLVDVTTREAFARRLSRNGADKSGWDITQLARVPGTFNTKARTGGRYERRCWVRGTGHRVTLIPRTLQTYSLAGLQKSAPRVDQPADVGEIADLAWPEVEHWLGNLGPLLGERNIPRRFKPHQQSYRVIAGDIVPVNDRGMADESTKRAFLARGLCWARYPDDAAAAILWHHTSADYIARKGTAWHKLDIARVLQKERAIVAAQVTDYQVRPITAAELRQGAAAAEVATIADVLPTSRARNDRPRKFDAPALFARYKAEPAICELPRKGRAAQLEISTATLDRLEDALETLGLIEIATGGKGTPGRVILQGGVINIGAPGVLSGPIEAPAQESQNTAPERAETANSHDNAKGETHPPPGTPQPPAAALTLSEAARQVFDELQVDPATGEKRRIYTKRARVAIAELGKWPGRWIDRAIADERQRRRIAAMLVDIRQMKPNTLKAQIRLMERLAEKSRREETNLYRFAEWAAREMRAELATRPAQRPAHKPSEARPDLRTTAADIRYEYEQRLLAEIEPQRRVPARALARPLASVAPSGGVCSPNQRSNRARVWRVSTD
jgi:hypothetical protein